MAKVKRSEVAMAGQQGHPVADQPMVSQPLPGQPMPGQPMPGQPMPVPLTDPRDATIRNLRVALTVVGVVALALAVALAVVLIRGLGQTTPPPAPASPSPSSSSSAVYLTKYVAVNPDRVKDGAIVVEVHTDYQCPWCGRAEQIYGQALGELSQSGDIDLRIHLRTLIGDQVIHNDSSERASVAALCADRAGSFWAYHSAVFANQPEEGVGYTDDQLRGDFAAQAGLTGRALTDFQACYDDRATADEVHAMEDEGAAAGINGTPTFFVNGVKVNFDLQSDATAVQAITADQLLPELQKVVAGQ